MPSTRPRDFGITILFTVAWTPPWALPNPLPKGVGNPSHVRPKNSSDYVRFVQAAVNRYSPVGRARVPSVVGTVSQWEIWNEPNLATALIPDDPVAYGNMLAASATGIHAIDPKAIVVSGGMAPASVSNGKDWSPPDFVNKMAPTGALKLINGVAIHPYGFPAWPDEAVNHNPLYRMVPTLYQAMSQNGVGNLKIWANKDGWPTASQSTKTIRTWDHHLQVGTEAYQAKELPLTIVSWFKLPYAGPFFIYNERDRCTQNTNWLCKTGVDRYDGTRKPAWTTVHALLAPNTTVAPTVTQQPVSQAVHTSQSYSFKASASGLPTPSVQWQRADHGGNTWTSIAGATSNTLTGTASLSDNGALFQAVFSNSAGNTTTASAPLTVTPPVAPGAPSVVSVTRGVRTISTAYAAPASDGGSPITGYKATCVSSNGGITRSSTLSLANPLVVGSLTSGKTYTCTAVARNAVGYSTPSAPSAAVVATNVPGAPSIVSATPGVKMISVAYRTSASGGGSAITGYRATCVSSDGGVTKSSTLSRADPLVVSALTSGKTYTCTAVAKNAVGYGAASVASIPARVF